MQQVTTPVKTMSSREIAKITGKKHTNVLRDIESMLSQLKTEPRNFESTFENRGKNYKCYNLPRRECEILVTGSIAFQTRVGTHGGSPVEFANLNERQAMVQQEKSITSK